LRRIESPAWEELAEMMRDIFSRSYRIRSYEADFRGLVKPVALLNYLQDAASGHADLLGFSLLDLRARNATWLLSRYHVRVDRYPAVAEKLLVTTWRSLVDGIYAFREFHITGEDASQVGCATSSWVLLNLRTRRPARINDLLPELPVIRRRALDDDFPKLPKPGSWGFEQSFRARTADQDLNRHVNHAVYAEWALETVPLPVLQERCLSDIEIAYMNEAVSGDTIISRAEKADSDVFLHQLVREEDGRELTRLRTVWRAFSDAECKGL
jgi:acyl-ACP thioesterase